MSAHALDIAHTAHGYECRKCPLIVSVAVAGTTFAAESAAEMLTHLRRHDDAGYPSPPLAVARLVGEMFADSVVDTLPEGEMPSGPWRGSYEQAGLLARAYGLVGSRGVDLAEIERERVSEHRIRRGGRAEQALRLGIGLDQLDAVRVAAGESDSTFETYHVMNPYDDGIGMDEYVDWLIDAGYSIADRKSVV